MFPFPLIFPLFLHIQGGSSLAVNFYRPFSHYFPPLPHPLRPSLMFPNASVPRDSFFFFFLPPFLHILTISCLPCCSSHPFFPSSPPVPFASSPSIVFRNISISTHRFFLPSLFQPFPAFLLSSILQLLRDVECSAPTHESASLGSIYIKSHHNFYLSAAGHLQAVKVTLSNY